MREDGGGRADRSEHQGLSACGDGLQVRRGARTDGDIGGGDNLPSDDLSNSACPPFAASSSSRTCQKWATRRERPPARCGAWPVRLRRLLQDGGQDEGGVRHGWLVPHWRHRPVDSGGYLRIVDRKKNIFKLAGERGREIEMALMRCPRGAVLCVRRLAAVIPQGSACR